MNTKKRREKDSKRAERKEGKKTEEHSAGRAKVVGVCVAHNTTLLRYERPRRHSPIYPPTHPSIQPSPRKRRNKHIKPCTASPCVAPHYTPSHLTALHRTTLNRIAVHRIIYCVAPHRITPHRITAHCTAPQSILTTATRSSSRRPSCPPSRQRMSADGTLAH